MQTLLAMFTYCAIVLLVINATADGMRIAGKDHTTLRVWTQLPRKQLPETRKSSAMEDDTCAPPSSADLRALQDEKQIGSPGSRGWFSEGCTNETDQISLEPIGEGKGVCLDGKCYDIDNLAKWLRQRKTVPHNNQPFLVKQYEALGTTAGRSIPNILPEASPISYSNTYPDISPEAAMRWGIRFYPHV
jgi:hypothetical protein